VTVRELVSLCLHPHCKMLYLAGEGTSRGLAEKRSCKEQALLLLLHVYCIILSKTVWVCLVMKLLQVALGSLLKLERGDVCLVVVLGVPVHSSG